ncbi:MAG TPA: hypothetical protein P5560_06755 [Thermotogota bacterium]|nr:hypothetical protein [Thermotogota bacterium]HRW92630.1 hypothetical protein [Thermotogota bacterium]
MDGFSPETNGINLYNESQLHAGIKEWMFEPGDRLEVPLEGYVIDLVRGEELIEIQTRNLGKIVPKLFALLPKHPVRVVMPIIVEKTLHYLDPSSGASVLRRKSPAHQTLWDLFAEWIFSPELFHQAGFTMQVLEVSVEETRCDNGKGSWRRKGVQVQQRVLECVHRSHVIRGLSGLAELLPVELPPVFGNENLVGLLGVSPNLASKISYTYRKAGVFHTVGKRGRKLLFAISPASLV